MKSLVIGVKRVKGIAKATGNAFDVTRALIATPIVPSDGDKLQVSGYGLELMEVPMDETALGQFRAVKFPTVLELVTDHRPFRGKLELTITGIAAEKVAA